MSAKKTVSDEKAQGPAAGGAAENANTQVKKREWVSPKTPNFRMKQSDEN